MGNRKFRLSDMIPNAWFYKLKEMGKDKPSRNPPPAKKPNPSPPQTLPVTTGATKAEPPHPDSISQTRKSYYFTRELNPKTTPKSSGSSELLFPNLDPPRKSSKKRRSTTKKRPTATTTTTKCSSSSSSVSAGIHSFREKSGSPPLPESTTTTSSSPDHLFSLQNSSISGDGSCIVIDVDRKSLIRKTEDPVSIPRLELPRIRTERKKFNDLVKQVGGALESIDDPIKQKKSSVKSRDTGDNEFLSVKVSRDDSMAPSVFKEQGNRPVRRFPTGSPRVRVRINSPRLARRAQMNSSRRSISSSSSRRSISSDSLAVVKSSFDPKRDFRESMVEMIVENNIRATKDLEELLACYLSLNSDEYHDVIIQVFRQIWFDLNDIRGVKEVVA